MTSHVTCIPDIILSSEKSGSIKENSFNIKLVYKESGCLIRLYSINLLDLIWQDSALTRNVAGGVLIEQVLSQL